MDSPTDLKFIRTVIDKQLTQNRSRSKYAFSFPTELIPVQLIDTSIEPDDEGYSFWKPVVSEVSDTEISELETYLKSSLPDSYKFFLKQYYFIDFYLGDSLRFFDNKPGELVQTFQQTIERYYPSLLERKIIPFARYHDWGVAAFITSEDTIGGEYKIAVLDHDDGYDNIDVIAKDFIGLFSDINRQIDQRSKTLKNDLENNA